MLKNYSGMWIFFLIIALFVLVWFLSPFIFLYPPSPEVIAYSDFLEISAKPYNVASVEVEENSAKTSGKVVEVKLKDGRIYKADFPFYLYPGLPEKLQLLELSGVKIDRQPESSFSWFNLLLLILPIAFVVYMIRRLSRQQTNGFSGNGLGLMTKTRAQRTDSPEVKKRFADVAGIDEAREELEDVVDFLRNPEKYSNLGARIPKGVLLVGEPGTGKTLLARAIAGEADVPFFSMSGSEFVEIYVGVGAARVRDLFDKARKEAPCIVFIDEIDAVGRRRGAGLGQGHDEREQTLNQILVELDGFDERTNIIVLAATNRPDILDPALLRPGRFDRKVVINKPDIRGREAILAVHTKGKPLASDVKIMDLARALPGVTGADLENVVNEAAIIAAKRGESTINNSCFLEAIDKILMGKGRKLVMDESDKRLIAFHEAGHAVVSKKLTGTDPIRKISITARERSLGQTLSLPEKDRYIVSESYLLNWMSVCLGGRMAEEIFLPPGSRSTGAQDDLEKSTEIVTKMVCSWGMSRLGPRVFRAKEEAFFLGREVTRKEDVSPQTLKEIDDEEARIIQERCQEARDILSSEDGKKKVELLVEALLKKETLEQDEINKLFDESSNKVPV